MFPFLSAGATTVRAAAASTSVHLVTNRTRGSAAAYKIPRWFFSAKVIFLVRQLQSFTNQLFSNWPGSKPCLISLLYCRGGRRGRMQNAMIWIFLFSALVAVQNVANKVVGREGKKSTTLIKVFASHDSNLCYTFLTLRELFDSFPFFFSPHAISSFLYLTF